MKMSEGGFRPAFNVQLVTTTDAARAIVGVTHRGSDQGQRTPILEQIEARTGVEVGPFAFDIAEVGGDRSHLRCDLSKSKVATLVPQV